MYIGNVSEVMKSPLLKIIIAQRLYVCANFQRLPLAKCGQGKEGGENH